MEINKDPFAGRDKYPDFLLLFNVNFQQAESLNVIKNRQFVFTLPANYMNGNWFSKKKGLTIQSAPPVVKIYVGV